jgi:hypothetical protein
MSLPHTAVRRLQNRHHGNWLSRLRPIRPMPSGGCKTGIKRNHHCTGTGTGTGTMAGAITSPCRPRATMHPEAARRAMVQINRKILFIFGI